MDWIHPRNSRHWCGDRCAVIDRACSIASGRRLLRAGCYFFYSSKSNIWSVCCLSLCDFVCGSQCRRYIRMAHFHRCSGRRTTDYFACGHSRLHVAGGDWAYDRSHSLFSICKFESQNIRRSESSAGKSRDARGAAAFAQRADGTGPGSGAKHSLSPSARKPSGNSRTYICNALCSSRQSGRRSIRHSPQR